MAPSALCRPPFPADSFRSLLPLLLMLPMLLLDDMLRPDPRPDLPPETTITRFSAAYYATCFTCPSLERPVPGPPAVGVVMRTGPKSELDAPEPDCLAAFSAASLSFACLSSTLRDDCCIMLTFLKWLPAIRTRRDSTRLYILTMR